MQLRDFRSWLEEVRSRNPCLSLEKCRSCAQHWYIAADTVDDIWYLRRLTEAEADQAKHSVWPATFDAFPNVWPNVSTDEGPKARPDRIEGGIEFELIHANMRLGIGCAMMEPEDAHVRRR